MSELIPSKEFSSAFTLVSLKDAKLGHEIKASMQTFPLSTIVSETTLYLGSDKFKEVYFRTKSGNIYKLDENGILIDANYSKRITAIVKYVLSKNELETAVLFIGKPFKYTEKGVTTEITEIVAVSGQNYDANSLERLTRGKYNNIIEDYERNMPLNARDTG